MAIDEACRTLGVSQQTLHRWKWKLAGLGAAKLRRSLQLAVYPGRSTIPGFSPTGGSRTWSWSLAEDRATQIAGTAREGPTKYTASKQNDSPPVLCRG